jgi:hypothetical protein
MTRTLPAALILVILAAVLPASAETPTDTPPVPPVFEPARLEGEKGAYLIGPLTRDGWNAFAPELQAEYAGYEPSPDLVRALSYTRRDVTITCVLGTWCSDSRREVPRFWKLLDMMDVPDLELVMLGVGRTDAPEAAAWLEENGVAPGYRQRFAIELVPTFIVTGTATRSAASSRLPRSPSRPTWPRSWA